MSRPIHSVFDEEDYAPSPPSVSRLSSSGRSETATPLRFQVRIVPRHHGHS
jgi:hypothetical protein